MRVRDKRKDIFSEMDENPSFYEALLLQGGRSGETYSRVPRNFFLIIRLWGRLAEFFRKIMTAGTTVRVEQSDEQRASKVLEDRFKYQPLYRKPTLH